jgi:hypothetical protein
MGRECGGHKKGIACERRRTCGGVLGRGPEQIADTEQAPRPSPIIHLHAHEVDAQPSELLRTTQWLPYRLKHCAKKNVACHCNFARVVGGDASAPASQKTRPIRFSIMSSTWPHILPTVGGHQSG